MSKQPLPGVTQEDLDLVHELRQQNTDQMQRRRLHERVVMRAAVTIRPGNSSERDEFDVDGVTNDLSQGGCSAIFPTPIRVGDIYRLEFNLEAICLPLVFARCLRCRLVHEEAFETGFSFFTPLSLPLKSPSPADDEREAEDEDSLF